MLGAPACTYIKLIIFHKICGPDYSGMFCHYLHVMTQGVDRKVKNVLAHFATM